MAKAKNSAPSDAERRRMLNEERTPRKNFVYEMEATCEVNPITGRSYWAEGDSDYVKDSLLGGVSYSDKCNNLINIYVPATPSEFIEYQFALARMDVRDGKEGKEGKLSQGEYDVQLRNVSAVTKRFREAGISLDCITSPEALKDTMNDVAFSERMRELMPLEEILKDTHKKKSFDLIRTRPEDDRFDSITSMILPDLDRVIKEKSQFRGAYPYYS